VTTFFECGPPTDHKCNHDGPEDVRKAISSKTGKEYVVSVSSTCSVCGSAAIDRAYWDDDDSFFRDTKGNK
jgi:hypothetical protein